MTYHNLFINYRFLHGLVLFELVLATLFAVPQAAAQTTGPLFQDATLDSYQAGRAEDGQLVLRERLVTLDLQLLSDHAQRQTTFDRAIPVKFNLFPDRNLSVMPTQLMYNREGAGLTWIGEVVGQSGKKGGQAIVTIYEGIAACSLHTVQGEFFRLTYLGQGVYAVRQIDQGRFPPELPPVSASPGPALSDPPTVYDDGSLIDVMVLYTKSARISAGGEAAMQALIQLAIAETNQGYANSQVVQRLRLVHTYQVNYSEGGGASGFNDALEDVTGQLDGNMDEIHALRDQYGADMVSLWINNGSYCGLAWLMTSTQGDFSDSAFSVIHLSCATGYYSFAHEMGHNQGSHHDRYVTGSREGVFDYSYAYVQQAASPKFRTIMAYGNACGSCTRENYWSNPAVMYNGWPTGVDSQDPDSADNHLSLNNTRQIAANWRSSSNPPVTKEFPWTMYLPAFIKMESDPD